MKKPKKMDKISDLKIELTDTGIILYEYNVSPGMLCDCNRSENGEIMAALLVLVELHNTSNARLVVLEDKLKEDD